MPKDLNTYEIEPINKLTIPSPGGDEGQWGAVLEQQTFRTILANLLWLKANSGSPAVLADKGLRRVRQLTALETPSGSHAIDPSRDVHVIAPTGDCALYLSPYMRDDGLYTTLLFLRRGGHNIYFGSNVLWPGGVEPTPSAGADAYDIYRFRTYDGGARWFGALESKGYPTPAHTVILLDYNEDFANAAWTKNAVTVVSTSVPGRHSAADRFMQEVATTAPGGYLEQVVDLAAGPHTIAIDLKKVQTDAHELRLLASDGSLLASLAGSWASWQALATPGGGVGIYGHGYIGYDADVRVFFLTLNLPSAAAGARFRIYPAGSGSGSQLLQGAILRPGDSPNPYAKTPLGLVANNNLLTYPNDFNQWQRGPQTTLAANAAMAPDNSNTAWRVQMDAVAGPLLRHPAVGVTPDLYAFRVYIKNNGGGALDLRLSYGSNQQLARVTKNVTNGWDQYELAHPPQASQTPIFCEITNSGRLVDCYIWTASLQKFSAA